MIFSTTTLNTTLTTKTTVVFDYKVLGTLDPYRISIPRKAFNRLLNLTAQRMTENDGLVGSVRALARWAVNGCPCNLAEEIGANDANQVYAVFRYWNDSEAIEKVGNSIWAPEDTTNSATFRRLARLTAA